MNALQITFSPTGGTDKVTEIITKAWGIAVNKIDLCNAETNSSSLAFECAERKQKVIISRYTL